jgi:hypothetical protein
MHLGRRTQLTFTLAALFRQDMTKMRLAPLEATRARFLEALGRSAIGL